MIHTIQAGEPTSHHTGATQVSCEYVKTHTHSNSLNTVHDHLCCNMYNTLVAFNVVNTYNLRGKIMQGSLGCIRLYRSLFFYPPLVCDFSQHGNPLILTHSHSRIDEVLTDGAVSVTFAS